MHHRALRRTRLLAVLFGVASLSVGACRGEPPAGSACGDGKLDTSEACDDGNAAAGDGCSPTCRKEAPPSPSCGDGKLDTGEACDDGNAAAGDGCSPACQKEAPPPPRCGDGKLDPGEACDDNNTIAGDGCSAACKKEPPPPICGNGDIDPGEPCDDGNAIDGDGCEASCTKTPPKEIVCGDLPAIPEGTCEVTPGTGAMLLSGVVLTPGVVYRGGHVLVDTQGMIACVGCECADAGPGATSIVCPSGVISPGLINTHDHITYTQNSPLSAAAGADSSARFEHRHEWRLGLRCHDKIDVPGGATDDEIRWGELRFLLGGATSTAGAGSTPGLLRNLDKIDQEGLGQPLVDLDTFPLGDSSGMLLSSGCNYPKITAKASIDGKDAYLAHVAEGIDAYALNEFACVSSFASQGQDLVQPQTAIIHGIGLTAQDFAEMAADGASLIWSPRSNVALYGDTASVVTASRLGVPIALGTDWIASGSMNMIRELRCAEALSRTRFDGFFTDEELWLMATANAAAATATDDKIGVLAAGKVADISIWNGAMHKDHRAIIDADPKDVVLVLRGGKALYGDEAVLKGIPGTGSCEALDVCGAPKEVCLADEIGKSFADLKGSVGSIYPAFFCGVPDDEPTCVPSRPVSVGDGNVYTGEPSADDADADGIPDVTDNCPSMFNPIRPMDKGAQADYDDDGDGDPCDTCPINAGAVACAPWTFEDADSDGAKNASDNCPFSPNADQSDGDMDGRGDVCDACPTESNPDGAPCAASIYDIKSGAIPVGAYVSVSGALVTARSDSGFFVQVAPGSPGDQGADWSGIYVYEPSSTVAAGDLVTISSAWIGEYYGQVQLSNPTVKVEQSGVVVPEPVEVASADAATCGARAKALEGVLVEVAGPTVTGVPKADEEFEIDSALVVGAELYLTTPFPTVGDPFAALRGILSGRFGASKLAPRGPGDLLPTIADFGPPQSFVYTASSDVPTFPVALTVALSRPTEQDTFVAIAPSSPALAVTNGGVTVPKGQSSAVVFVTTGASPAETVTLTATLGAFAASADVRVLDPGEQPALLSLTPQEATVATGDAAALFITLDIPASEGGVTVDLSLDAPAGAAGSVPPSVTVPAGALGASFAYTAGAVRQNELITATLGPDSFVSSVSVVGRVVINEVDYDQPGTDNAEFIEIYNGSGAPVSLAGLAVVLVNGASSASYTTIGLASAGDGTLGADQYLVVCWSDAVAAAVPPGALLIKPSVATGKVQNGDTDPDGIALVDKTNGVLLDALSYKGSLTAASISGLPAPVSLVEGNPTPALDSSVAPGSLCRIPSGMDMNNAASDFAFSATPTPGAPNMP